MPPPGPFGPFEISREIESGRGASVYRARKEGDPKGEYVVKVFSLERQVAEEGQEAVPELETLFHDLGESFASRINLQKAAAESSPYFTPILAGGHDERGPWYATPFYARSVKGMLERLTALEAPDLFHIIHSVVQAALHLKRTAGRSHGNLKPANVFIEGVGKPRASRVLVSDPLPGDAQEAANYERADLRAIGELLYQLVLKRKADFTWVMVPIEATAEWPRLFGKKTTQWLDLCNRLLDPQLSLDNMSLERVEGDLQKLRPPRQVLLPAAAGCVAIALVLFMTYLLFGGLRVRVEADADTITITSGDGPPQEEHLAHGRYTAAFRWPSRGAVNEIKVEAPFHYKTNLSLHYGWTDFRKVTRIRLVRVTVPLLISADSTVGAEIWLGTNKLGAYPEVAKLDLPVGLESKVIARFPDFPDYVSVFSPTNTRPLPPKPFVFAKKSIRAEIKGEPPFDLVALKRNDAIVQAVTNITSSSYTFQGLGPGRYTVAVRKRFYEPAESVPVDIQADASVNVEVALRLGSGKIGPRSNQQNVTYSLQDAEHKTVPLAAPLREGAPTQISAGTNYLVASWRDWEPVTNQVVVEAGESYDVSFQFVSGFLLLTEVRPEGTSLELLDKASKSLPTQLAAGVPQALKPGGYAVRGRKDGFGEQTVPFAVVAGATNAIAIHLQQDQGTLVIITQPPLPGAKVTVQDATDQGRPPRLVEVLPESGQLSTNLPPGTYSVRGEFQGLDPLAFTLGLQKGGRVSTNLDFQYWTLSLASQPGNASVKIDGADAGRTPLTNHLVRRTGSNYFVLTPNEGYLPDTFWTNAPRAANWFIVRTLQLPPITPPAYTNALGMAFAQIKELPGSSGGGYMGKFEVTQNQYEQLMGTNPSYVTARGPDLPVNYVSPLDARKFCAKLTDADTRLQSLAGPFRYALPTQDQWRYCAANTSTNGAVFGSFASPRRGPERVGTGPPNKFGLYDVLGNVAEICSLSSSGSDFRAFGGSFQPGIPSVDIGKSFTQDSGSMWLGFRVVLVPTGAR